MSKIKPSKKKVAIVVPKEIEKNYTMRVLELKRKSNLSDAEIAQAMGMQTYHKGRIEEYGPARIATLVKLANIFNVTIAYLLGESDDAAATNPHKEIHFRLAELMAQTGALVTEVADALNIHYNSITFWKSGKYYPTVDACRKLAEYFGVSIDYLLGLSDNRTAGRFTLQDLDLPPDADGYKVVKLLSREDPRQFRYTFVQDKDGPFYQADKLHPLITALNK